MKRLALTLFLISCAIFANAQYCTPIFGSGCSGGWSEIDSVWITGTQGVNISNLGSGCSNNAPSYTTYYPMTVNAYPGDVVDITLGSSTNSFMVFRVWIDWNNDVQFSSNESVATITASGTPTASATFTVPAAATVGKHRIRIVGTSWTMPLANEACGTNFWNGEAEDYDIEILSATPCSGTPAAGILNAGATSYTICPSVGQNLYVNGLSNVAGLTLQWQSSPIAANAWTNIAGATGQIYTTAIGAGSLDYRLQVTCAASASTVSTTPVTVAVQGPTPATVPYFQSFENWTSYCKVLDAPSDKAWIGSPNIGDLAWRRDDQGASAAWQWTGGGSYTPTATHGSHSARIHTYYGLGSGNLDLHIDLSSLTGTKTLSFDHMSTTFNGWVSLDVQLSTNGGSTFTPLGSFTNTANSGVWLNASFPIASNASNAVIRFTGNGTTNYDGDIAIDNLQIAGPCSGTPIAGTIMDTSACPNDSFALNLVGNFLANGLSYNWQGSLAAGGPWATIATTSVPYTKFSQINTTYYRCIVTCTSSGLSASTPPVEISMSPFYNCYCKTATPTSTGDNVDIGRVFIRKTTSSPTDTIIENGVIVDTINNFFANATYSNFQYGLPIKKMYRDSTYDSEVSTMSNNSWWFNSHSRIFIDYNQDGIFQSTEAATGGSHTPPSYTAFGSITVPSNAVPGITGLRVITNTNGSTASIDACSSYWSGESEDYLVEIIKPNCAAPISAGTVYISDTLLCPGYQSVLIDTTYTDTNVYVGLTRVWQRSTDAGNTWSTIVAATADTLVVTPSTNTIYRVRLVCNIGDTAYSAPVSITLINSNACYPASGAQWGTSDTSDNGAFGIGTYMFTYAGGGSHISNPSAIRTRTDLSTDPTYLLDLYTDSTYALTFYSIIKREFHANAKVTMFIDYNADGLYQPASERVFTGTSDPINYIVFGSFKTPVSPILNTPTGLRVISNDNTNPNTASDNGVGLYVSGETEDYRVRFRKKPIIPLSIASALDASNVSVYPNPTTGMVFIDVMAKQLNTLNIVVTNISGQEVFRQANSNVDGKFSTSIDLGNLARGTYMLKLQSEKGSIVRSVLIH
jgi:hypothetical protein